MNVLIFDADQSTASLGGPEKIKEKLGFEPLTINGGVDQIHTLIDKITTVKEEPVTHALFQDTGSTEHSLEFNDTAKAINLQGLVIDSLSVVGYQTRTSMVREAKTASMDLQLWGRYGEKMMSFIFKLSRLKAPVIVNCHLDRDKDDNGGPIEVPDLKGQAKLAAARYFDVVAYTVVSRSRKGDSTFSWQIMPDGRRSQAKSRLPFATETGRIDQDFSSLIEHYQKNGIPYPKILVIGDSGSGKTHALNTLSTITTGN